MSRRIMFGLIALVLGAGMLYQAGGCALNQATIAQGIQQALIYNLIFGNST